MKKKHTRIKIIAPQSIQKYGQVLLTKVQRKKLNETFGEDLAEFAISLLNDKIKANPQDKKLVNAKNHYQYFRSDGKIINFALEVMNNSESYGYVRW